MHQVPTREVDEPGEAVLDAPLQVAMIGRVPDAQRGRPVRPETVPRHRRAARHDDRARRRRRPREDDREPAPSSDRVELDLAAVHERTTDLYALEVLVLGRQAVLERAELETPLVPPQANARAAAPVPESPAEPPRLQAEVADPARVVLAPAPSRPSMTPPTDRPSPHRARAPDACAAARLLQERRERRRRRSKSSAPSRPSSGGQGRRTHRG